MFRVDDVYDEAKKIIGVCDDTKLFRWLGDAVSLVCNKADLEGWKGYLDICTLGCRCTDNAPCNASLCCGKKCIALPREVETVIGVNISGQPALGVGQLFTFHLNGPGDCRHGCELKWQDQGQFHPVYRDIIVPSKLVAYLQTEEDDGKELIVYGYDQDGNLLRRKENGTWLNGYKVPTIFGVAVPDMEAPVVSRITGVFKQRTAGTVRLSTIDDSGTTGILLGVYEPDETTPQFRRIQINRGCNWVRIAFLKTNPVFFSRYDHIALKSRVGLLLALQARKHYHDNMVAEAHAYEADAARLELEAQSKAEPPVYSPPQVIDMSQPRDKYDYDIR